jgi:protein O-mannosyl-transferase
MESDASSEQAHVGASRPGRSPQRAFAWIIGGLTLVVFLPSLFAGFVFDDVSLISENQYAQSVRFIGRPFSTHLWDIYRSGATGDVRRFYRPIVAVSYLLNWVLGDGRAWIFHLFNVLCHAAAVVLAARIARRWTGQAALGAIAVLVFALHPSRTENVTWISGRTDLLMTLFSLVAVECAHAASRAVGTRTAVFGVGTIVATVLAIMSKENAVLTGLLIAVDAALVRHRPRRILTSLALVTSALGLVYVIVRALFYPVILDSDPAQVTPAHGMMTCWAYLERVVFPWPQTFFHRTLVAGSDGRYVPLPLIVLGLSAVLGYLALLVVAWRRDRAAMWLLLAALGFIGPLLNFTDTGIGVTTSDRFLYVPLLLLTCAVLRLASTRLTKLLHHRTALLAGAGILVVWVAIIEVRTFDYVDDDTFWQHELALDPNNPLVISEVSRLHARRGELEEAFEGSRRILSAESSRYVVLSTPEARAQSYLRALGLHGALSADGDVRTLEAVFHELNAFLHGEPQSMRGKVGEFVLGARVPRSTLRWLDGPDGIALAAEGALVAARIGEDARAREFLARVPDEQIWRTENPLNVVLTHARLGQFDRARERLSLVSRPPEGVQAFGQEMVEELKARIDRAERSMIEADKAVPERATVLRAVAMGELGAYLRALRLLRPVYDANRGAPGVAPLYVQLLVAARMDREALAQAELLLGPERGRATIDEVRAQLPERTRGLRAPEEPSPWWKP